jgi:UDP-N-acetylglucosamine--N-acetylmuramyl-(pentapeptide) pyrophosphoryl-undecaprenol N-acetylglucosamine transferase
MEKVPQAGYNIEVLAIAGFNRSSLIKNIGLPFKLIKSFFQVRRIFNTFKPIAVVGVGGYSSFPVLKYAQTRGIKTFIHESNSFAGKSNILLGKNATKIFVATDGMEKFFKANKLKITGNPVRKLIVENNISRTEAIEFFKLSPNKKTILSIGGSLGAKSINEAINKYINEFEKNELQLIWQTGKNYATTAQQTAKGRANIYTSDFITNMEYAYAAADLIISRSGAMAIAEICVAKKPTIFVPYPFAAEDHQTVNAENLVSKSAALTINDNEVLDKLVSSIIALSNNVEQQHTLKQNIAKLAIINADEVIANEILSVV